MYEMNSSISLWVSKAKSTIKFLGLTFLVLQKENHHAAKTTSFYLSALIIEIYSNNEFGTSCTMCCGDWELLRNSYSRGWIVCGKVLVEKIYAASLVLLVWLLKWSTFKRFVLFGCVYGILCIRRFFVMFAVMI